MSQSHYSPSNPVIIEHPPCPKCATQMFLARIAPNALGYNRQTFECPKCEHSENIIVKYK
jgi:ribosomal protein S27AE